MDGNNGLRNNSQDTTATTTQLLCWGCGEFGQHCHGHNRDVGFDEALVDLAVLDKSSNGVFAVACGASHSVLVTGSGQIYAWGNGNSGQLGCADQSPRLKPTQVHFSPRLPPGVRIRSAACGGRHTMVVLTNGHVYSFGNNFYAQLGYNFRDKSYKENQLRPHLLEFLVHRPVRQVACGDKHSLFLLEDGTVAAVGNNAHGQIGDGGNQESVVPKPVELDHAIKEITCGPNHNLVITEEGGLYGWGYGKACGRKKHDVVAPMHIDIKGRKVRQAAGGSSHSLCLTASGKVYCWGFGPDGQLGLGSEMLTCCTPRRLCHAVLEKVSQVACGDAFSAAVTVSGRLCMWGRNSHTIEAGLGSLHRVFEPRCLNRDTGDGGLNLQGLNPKGSLSVRSVHCGAWHAVALQGLPEPLLDSDEEDETSADTDNGSNHSVNSWISSLQDGSVEEQEVTARDVEVSAPPHATSSSASGLQSKLIPVAVARGQTRLTLAEFYEAADGSSKPERGWAEVSSAQPVSPALHNNQQRPPLRPLVVEVPSASSEPDSDGETPLPLFFTGDAMSEELMNSSSDSTSKASQGLRILANLPRLLPKEDAVVLEPSPSTPSTTAEGTKLPPASNGASAKGRIPVTRTRSRTTGTKIGAIVQLSRTPAKKFSLPKEPTMLVSKQIGLLNTTQLLSGSAAGVAAAATTNPDGTTSRFTGVVLSKESSEGFDMSSTSASESSIGVRIQRMPTLQLGDDLEPHMDRSSTFFGALPAQHSRSPSKFFKKPAASWLAKGTSRLLTTARTPSTRLPFNRARTFTSGVTSVHQPAPVRDVNKADEKRTLACPAETPARGSGTGERKAVEEVPLPVQRLSAGKSYPPGQCGLPSAADADETDKSLIFSSATSWRQRRGQPHDVGLSHSDDSSADTTSKASTRKKAVCADRLSSGPTSTTPVSAAAAVVPRAPLQTPGECHGREDRKRR